MKTNLKRAVVGLALTFSMGMANAGTVSLGSYTFTYDDAFWGTGSGTTFAQLGNLFTFSNLGYSASSNGPRRGWNYASYFDANTTPAVSITANPGFQIASIDNGVAGFLSSAAGPAADSAAYANTSSTAQWSGTTPAAATDYSSSLTPVSSEAHSYNQHGTVTFAPNTTLTNGDFWTSGSVASHGIGSSASASLDAVSFSVAVTPVPEPSSWALMLGGFGLIGFMSYRRRQYF